MSYITVSPEESTSVVAFNCGAINRHVCDFISIRWQLQ